MQIRPICRPTQIALIGWVIAILVVMPAVAQERVSLKTEDGVTLSASFYASSEGKQAAPIVLLHDYKASRAVFDSLAKQLQNPPRDSEFPSYAVLTVDLRGHGGSTKRTVPGGGGTIELDAAKLKRDDFRAMVTFDVEAVRKYLVGRNDDEELNLNNLSLMGVGMGASVATLWAARDWEMQPLLVGKQGQDVKALILVSPRWKNRGLLLQQGIRQPGVQRQVAIMMIYGADDSKVRADVKRIYKQVEKFHPEPESAADEPRDLVALGWPNTRLQGSPLLKEIGEPAQQQIAAFIQRHVVEQEHEWSKRRRRIP